MEMTYRADSLEDIAKHFEQMAADCEARIDKSSTRAREVPRLQVTAETWREAARVLRNTNMGAPQ